MNTLWNQFASLLFSSKDCLRLKSNLSLCCLESSGFDDFVEIKIKLKLSFICFFIYEDINVFFLFILVSGFEIFFHKKIDFLFVFLSSLFKKLYLKSVILLKGLFLLFVRRILQRVIFFLSQFTNRQRSIIFINSIFYL